MINKNSILGTEDLISRCNEIHFGKFDYSSTEFVSTKAKIKIGCKKHGIFYQLPHDHLRGHGCKKCYFDERKKWSINQDEFLKANYHEKGAYWCSDKLSKSEHAIRGRATLLGLSKRQKFTHEIIPSFMWSSLKARAIEEGFTLDIDVDYIWEMYQNQKGKCALTGWDIKFGKTHGDNEVSVDRIDSKKGYIKGNVQLTDKLVNRCKLNCNEKYFYDLCSAITKNRSDDLMSFEIDWEDDIVNDTIRPMKRQTMYKGDKLEKHN